MAGHDGLHQAMAQLRRRTGAAAHGQRHPPARLRAAGWPGGTAVACERTRQFDHAGQGQPHPMRGAGHGLHPGDRPGCRCRRRGLGWSPADECVQAPDRFQSAQGDHPAEGRLPLLPSKSCGRHGTRPGTDHRPGGELTDAGDRPHSSHRLQQGQCHRPAGPSRWCEPAGGGPCLPVIWMAKPSIDWWIRWPWQRLGAELRPPVPSPGSARRPWRTDLPLPPPGNG